MNDDDELPVDVRKSIRRIERAITAQSATLGTLTKAITRLGRDLNSKIATLTEHILDLVKRSFHAENPGNSAETRKGEAGSQRSK